MKKWTDSNSMGNQIRIAWIAVFMVSYLGIRAQSQDYFVESAPETEGLSSASIVEFIDRLEQEIDAVHSFMIIRHGKLVSKGWWDPYGPEIPHVMHSVSKSFTSTAVGFAVKEELLSLDDLVVSFFPEKAPKDPSWQWKEMRIRDLLTMNTGHLEEPRPLGQEDWVQFFLESEVELMPGTVFKYNSMATYILSAIIQKVTGEKLVDYLDPRLFQPLKISKPEWDTCPMGINTGGWGLHIVTEDIAKLGQLYLQKGKWEEAQLLSEEWMTMATSKQVANGSNPANDWTQGYGFQFWMSRYNTYRGDGAMGQFCLVMPEQDAVVAITSGTNDMGGIMNIVWETLLPAMQDISLPANDKILASLEKKTADLQLKPTTGGLTTSISKRISNRKFQMKENEFGVKAITFNVNSKKPSVDMEMEGGTQTIAIGTNEFQKGAMDLPLPYTKNLEKKIAVSGAWTSDSQYTMRVYFYESPARMTYTFSFGDDGLDWETKLENALFGMQKLAPLKGAIE
ncbi:MAG: CubicO group peptidase (beta-lactamase class C family) [Cyclobacteriaceae bacterium]|jgi:CubicO group peptidase (beta-lactamase class C family)